MMTLEGKIAIVTGGTYGVGRGVATELARCGTRAFVTGRSTQEGPHGDPPVTGIRCDHRVTQTISE